MEQHIEIINNWNLRKVFEELENGNFKVPRFQRGYVWERSKIVKLLNSIYCQFPIGSFFIWVTDKTHKNFCREIEDLNLPIEPQSNSYSFILDGQQRITSLFVALRGKKIKKIDYSTICFNLEKKEFKIPRLKNEKHNVPAWKLFSTVDYGEVYKHYTLYDIDNETNLADNWRECYQIFSDYPISLIKSLKMDLDQVVTIFERINQGGKRLSLFDLVHASAWSPEFDLREKIKDFNSSPKIDSFGKIEEGTFTQALALNEFGDAKNEYQLKLTASICAEKWDTTISCIELAIDYIRAIGVKYTDFLPYNAFIPVIQYYFYSSKRKSISAQHSILIKDWFWTSTFSQRYSSSSLTSMKDDADWISKIASGVTVPNSFPVALAVKEISKIRMQDKSVIKNGILCLMAINEPRDFDNGQLVTLDRSNISRSNSKENHHFFPFSLRAKFGVDARSVNSILNFAFISSRLNREISNSCPLDYITRYGNINPNLSSHLESHFIDKKATIAISKNDFHGFLEARAEVIIKKLSEVLGDNLMELVEDYSEEEVDDEIPNE